MSAKLTRPGAMSEGRSFVVCLRRQAIKGGTAGCRHRAILSRVCAARCRDGNGRSDERARSAQTPTAPADRNGVAGRPGKGLPLFVLLPACRGLCRAGVFARRLGFAASLGLRDDASIVPYGRGAGHCRVLKDTCGGRAAMHPSARVAGTSPCRGGFANGFHSKGSPARGAVGASRPRGEAPCPADTLPGRRLGSTAAQGLPGRCKHRPLRTLGRALPGFAGYLRGQGGNAPFRLRLAAHPPPLQGRLLAGRLSRVGSVVAGGWRDDASIAPYGRGAGPCRGLKDTCGAGRQCTPPPALRAPPLAGEAFGGRLSRWVGDYGRFSGTMQASSPTDAGQGTAGVCRIPVGQGGNAPLSRLARQPTEGCGTWPYQYPARPPQTSPAGVNARPTILWQTDDRHDRWMTVVECHPSA